MIHKILNAFQISQKYRDINKNRNRSDDDIEDSLWEIKEVYDFDTEEIQVSIDAYRKRKDRRK